MSNSVPFSSRFQIDNDTRVCVVSLTGNLDPAAVDDLHPQVQELVRAGFRRFVFDLSELDYVGSLGLRLLVGLAHQVKSDGSVVLCEPKSGVRSIIEITRLDRVLKIYPNRTDAVDAART